MIMKIVDFKKLITQAKESGNPVRVQLYWTKDGSYVLQRDFGERNVSIVQSNRYALAILKPDGSNKIVDCWSDWPKSGQLTQLESGAIEYVFEFGKLVYTFK